MVHYEFNGKSRRWRWPSSWVAFKKIKDQDKKNQDMSHAMRQIEEGFTVLKIATAMSIQYIKDTIENSETLTHWDETQKKEQIIQHHLDMRQPHRIDTAFLAFDIARSSPISTSCARRTAATCWQQNLRTP